MGGGIGRCFAFGQLIHKIKCHNYLLQAELFLFVFVIIICHTWVTTMLCANTAKT